MGRLPFDPGKMSHSTAAQSKSSTGADAADAPITVSALAGLIDSALRQRVPAPVRVLGEISGYTDRTHWYFDLKDASSVVGCVMFASMAKRCRFKPTRGQQVVARGRVEFYSPQGRTTLIVDKLEPVGAGALDLAFKELCDDLRALGWFDPALKQQLPTFPRRIAVVTSKTGAALQDVLNTIEQRCPAVEVLLIDVPVQGTLAGAHIASALQKLDAQRERLCLDAILLTRGGGSIEDLWAFNERIVAEAIYKLSVPIVAAIGHETDTTIAELVADERCATPTQAAMRLTPDVEAINEQLTTLTKRLGRSLEHRIQSAIARVNAAATRPVLAQPDWILTRARERQDFAQTRLVAITLDRIGHKSRRIDQLWRRLEQHRPQTVFEKRRVRLNTASTRLALLMNQRTALQRQALSQLIPALETEASRRVVQMVHDLGSTKRELEAVGPMAVLKRGYSCTMDAKGHLIRSPEQVKPGAVIVTRLADGGIESVVKSGRSEDIQKQKSQKKGDSGPGKSSDGKDSEPLQLDLFDKKG